MVTPDFEALRLGDDSETYHVDSSEEVLLASVAMLSQTRRTLEIVSRHLDPLIYDTVEFSARLQRFIVGAKRASVRIIVMDSTPIIGRGHRVIDLAQRLTSYIELRNPGRQHANYNSAFLLADRIGSVHRILADRFDGVINFNDARAAKSLGEQFEEMWPLATPDLNFRRLSL